MDTPKKEFDPTVCFTFFSDWMSAIVDAETESDMQSEAYMLFKSIADYSLYGEEPDFDNNTACKSFKRFWPMIANQIDTSIKNRKRGFKTGSGPTEKAQKVIEECKRSPKASLRQIEKVTGVSKSEAGRIKQRYIINDQPSACPDGVTSACSDDFTSACSGDYTSAIPVVNVNANASTGHGTGRDTGQDTGQDNLFSSGGKSKQEEYSTKEEQHENTTELGVAYPPTPLPPDFPELEEDDGGFPF